MDNRFVFGMLLSSLILSQSAKASTMEETYGQNHVTIVINQNDKSKKSGVKKIAKKTVKTTKSKVVAKPAQKKQIVAAAPIIVKPAHIPMGKRVTLANQGYAHANGYNGTEENQILPSSTSLPPGPNLTTKIVKQEEKKAESPWGIKLRSYNAVDMNALENYGSDRDYTIRVWERVNISYNFDPDVSLALMPQYYHTWFQDQSRPQSTKNPGYNQSYASFLGDTALILEDKKIAAFGGSAAYKNSDGKLVAASPFVFGGSQSYFAPTSESAETSGMVGESRTDLTLSKSFGKLDLKWTEELRYYMQQYNTNAFLNATNGKPLANTAFRLLNLMDIGYNFTSKLNFTVETGVVNEYNYGDDPTGTAATSIDYLVMNPDLGYSFNDHFALDFGIWEVYGYTNPPKIDNGQTASYTPFAPYNGSAAGSWSGTELFLQGTVKF